MSTSYKYTTSLWPDTYYVLGHRMADYTLGHALLLERLKSPFVTGAGEPGLGDLKLAIALCKRPFPRALAVVAPVTRLGYWLSAIGYPVRYTRCPGRLIHRAALQFLAYLSGSKHHPKRVEKDGPMAGTPFLQQIKLTHMMALGKPELQTLCTPFAAALWDAMGAWELEGNAELYQEELLEELAAFKRDLKQRAAELFPSTINHQPSTRR